MIHLWIHGQEAMNCLAYNWPALKCFRRLHTIMVTHNTEYCASEEQNVEWPTASDGSTFSAGHPTLRHIKLQQKGYAIP